MTVLTVGCMLPRNERLHALIYAFYILRLRSKQTSRPMRSCHSVAHTAVSLVCDSVCDRVLMRRESLGGSYMWSGKMTVTVFHVELCQLLGEKTDGGVEKLGRSE